MSIGVHALVIALTPWIQFNLPAHVEARMDEQNVEEEAVFFLDLRTTAFMSDVQESAPIGDPTLMHEEPQSEVTEPPPQHSEAAPEALLESPRLAEPDAPSEVLEPVLALVDPPADPSPVPASADLAAAEPSEDPSQIAASAPASPISVGSRARTSVAGAWVVSAASWAAGAFTRPPPVGTAPPTAGSGGPAKVGETAPTFAPRVLSAPKPEYPDACRRRRIEGSVLCRMHVDRDGRVTDVDIVEPSGDERLDRAAVRALERWRFDPPRRAGEKLDSKVLHRVSFRLK